MILDGQNLDYSVLAVSPPLGKDQERLIIVRQEGQSSYLSDESYDRITQLCARSFQASIVICSVMDVTRQWFKSRVGVSSDILDNEDDAFSRYTSLLDGNISRRVVAVLDTQQDSRFQSNPLVVGPPYIRFYAGASLLLDGIQVGTLCIFDNSPRSDFDQNQRDLLESFADTVSSLMEETRRQQMDAYVHSVQLHQHILRVLQEPLGHINDSFARLQSRYRRYEALAKYLYASRHAQSPSRPLAKKQCKATFDEFCERVERFRHDIFHLCELLEGSLQSTVATDNIVNEDLQNRDTTYDVIRHSLIAEYRSRAESRPISESSEIPSLEDWILKLSMFLSDDATYRDHVHLSFASFDVEISAEEYRFASVNSGSSTPAPPSMTSSATATATTKIPVSADALLSAVSLILGHLMQQDQIDESDQLQPRGKSSTKITVVADLQQSTSTFVLHIYRSESGSPDVFLPSRDMSIAAETTLQMIVHSLEGSVMIPTLDQPAPSFSISVPIVRINPKLTTSAARSLKPFSSQATFISSGSFSTLSASTRDLLSNHSWRARSTDYSTLDSTTAGFFSEEDSNAIFRRVRGLSLDLGTSWSTRKTMSSTPQSLSRAQQVLLIPSLSSFHGSPLHASDTVRIKRISSQDRDRDRNRDLADAFSRDTTELVCAYTEAELNSDTEESSSKRSTLRRSQSLLKASLLDRRTPLKLSSDGGSADGTFSPKQPQWWHSLLGSSASRSFLRDNQRSHSHQEPSASPVTTRTPILSRNSSVKDAVETGGDKGTLSEKGGKTRPTLGLASNSSSRVSVSLMLPNQSGLRTIFSNQPKQTSFDSDSDK